MKIYQNAEILNELILVWFYLCNLGVSLGVEVRKLPPVKREHRDERRTETRNEEAIASAA